MKKIVFVFAAVLACSITIMACASEKKSKRSPSGVTIELSTATLGEITAANSTHTISAVIKSNGVVQENAAVNWAVNPTDFGEFSPNPASTTTFTAYTTKSGTGTITASYSGTMSSPITFAINQPVLELGSIVLVPSTTSVISPNTVTLTATAKYTDNTEISGATIYWNINNTSLGTLSSSSSVSGSVVTFTPSNVNTGTAIITSSCTYGGITKTSSVNITVGPSGPAATRYYIYIDNQANADANAVLDYAGMCWTYPGGFETNPRSQMTEQDDGQGCSPDSQKYYKIVNDYSINTHTSSGWNFKLKSGEKFDCTPYKTLVFYAKGTNAGDVIRIEFGSIYALGGADSGTKNWTTGQNGVPALTTSWQKYELSIDGVTRDRINVLVNFVFDPGAPSNIPAETVYIDYIYLEQ